ncbi:deoxyribose-phosphate aldolase [Azospirillum baldaniorum]|uniref:Deoxyribose-phosphate aldolase n=1 Tax=Azospirillum baldaniorum TaxID=1064539 RepID=A0A9P1NLL0_9PROT|nr:deoxyribose-phosphate aldolase [Azospirillum baldaniorum]AWJ90186.1 deoxyribose-phosphate aldolase [Azospirillum baldaniorum]TWA77263.1 deoxyribose-phosphate aldolase [Azospirillum brasilense]CCC97744.1 2-deoxyribose-5-phosphate aldolase,NAD(P)-linked [Azospirillum baldaniorum]
MKLPADLQRALDTAAAVKADAKGAGRAVGLLDLTSLNDDDTDQTVEALCKRAVTPAGKVAAVCVWPRFVKTARKALKGSGVKIATVVNFPSGEADAATVAAETKAAIKDGANEIDVVLPYRAFIDGARTQPMNVIRACREACGTDVTMKVILESGCFPDPELLAWAARDSIAAGADFLKTSTGKVQPAATLEAAALLLHVIHESGKPVGFKAAGGIRDADGAAAFLALATAIQGKGWAKPDTFRFGASALLDSLLATAGHGGKGEGKGEGKDKDAKDGKGDGKGGGAVAQPATAGY